MDGLGESIKALIHLPLIYDLAFVFQLLPLVYTNFLPFYVYILSHSFWRPSIHLHITSTIHCLHSQSFVLPCSIHLHITSTFLCIYLQSYVFSPSYILCIYLQSLVVYTYCPLERVSDLPHVVVLEISLAWGTFTILTHTFPHSHVHIQMTGYSFGIFYEYMMMDYLPH